MEVERLAALAVAAIAVATDVRTRRIPNLLTFGGALVALAYWGWSGGLRGLGHGASGWAVGVALFLPLFVVGGMGAGDVKLLGAIGAWMGPGGTLYTALYSVLAGGVLALAVALRHHYLSRAFRNLWALVGFWRVTGVKPMPGLTLDDAAGPKLPYGIAIGVGTVIAILLGK